MRVLHSRTRLRVAAQVHVFNETTEETRRVVSALKRQSWPVSAIVLVDNGSGRSWDAGALDGVTLLRSDLNLGVSGAVGIGTRYALEQGFDWLWIFDGDSVPEPDALEKLLAVYASMPASEQEEIGALHCAAILAPGRVSLGSRLTPGGSRPVVPAGAHPVECDSAIWSGSLLKLSTVRVVGMPRCGEKGYWDDFGLDYSDVEYYYRLRQAGYRVIVDPTSLVHHRLGAATHRSFLGRTIFATHHSPARRYLYFRNLAYFWIHLYPQRRWPPLLVWFLYGLLTTIGTIVVFETDRTSKVVACLRGLWRGIRKDLHSPYRMPFEA